MSHFLILFTPLREIVQWLIETYDFEILKNIKIPAELSAPLLSRKRVTIMYSVLLYM